MADADNPIGILAIAATSLCPLTEVDVHIGGIIDPDASNDVHWYNPSHNGARHAAPHSFTKVN
eukprot:5651688-Amphidinium_carterae.1